MALKLVLIFAVSICVKSCGILTHSEIAKRALEFYDSPAFGPGVVKRVLTEQKNAFHGGASFPDTFFNDLCERRAFESVSEDTHWGRYQKVAWDYFRKTYPDPIGNENGERLLAFLMGLASHQVADVLWHGLEGLTDGLLITVSRTTFDGNNRKAEDYIDMGGDILVVVDQNTDYSNQWFIPTEDVVNIFEDYYGNEKEISNKTLEFCTGMLLLLRTILKVIGVDQYTEKYVSESSIFLDEYQDYFMGGIDDMAAWTRIVWDISLNMAVNGTENCEIVKNPMTIRCNGLPSVQNETYVFSTKKDRNLKMYDLGAKHLGLNFAEAATKYIQMIHIDGGVQLTAKLKNLKIKLGKCSKKKKNCVRRQSEHTFHAIFHINTTYAKFGWSIATGDLNGDGVEDILIGAPAFKMKGCLFLVFGSNDELVKSGEHNLEEVSDLILCGDDSDPLSRFGHQILISDFNNDGINDIIVGAPTSGLIDIKYDGAVHVFLATKTTEKNISFDQQPVIITPPTTSSTRSSTFGWSLVKLDDEVFLASARHRTDGSERQTGSVFSIKFESNTTLLVSGKDQYQWSGSVVTQLSSPKVFAVGSPLWTDCSESSLCKKCVGKVELFNEQRPLSTLVGPTEFSNFGSSIIETELLVDGGSKKVLVVGSPTSTYEESLKHAGSVHIFDLEALLNGSTQDQAFLFKIESDKRYSRFGKSVHQSANYLWISAPRYHTLKVEQELGYLFGIPSQTSFPLGNITDVCEETSNKPCPTKYAKIVLSPPDGELRSQFGHRSKASQTRKISFFWCQPQGVVASLIVPESFMFTKIFKMSCCEL